MRSRCFANCARFFLRLFSWAAAAATDRKRTASGSKKVDSLDLHAELTEMSPCLHAFIDLVILLCCVAGTPWYALLPQADGVISQA